MKPALNQFQEPLQKRLEATLPLSAGGLSEADIHLEKEKFHNVYSTL